MKLTAAYLPTSTFCAGVALRYGDRCFAPFPCERIFVTSSLAASIAFRSTTRLRELSGLGRKVPDELLTRVKYFSNAV